MQNNYGDHTGLTVIRVLELQKAQSYSSFKKCCISIINMEMITRLPWSKYAFISIIKYQDKESLLLANLSFIGWKDGLCLEMNTASCLQNSLQPVSFINGTHLSFLKRTMTNWRTEQTNQPINCTSY